jgi:hypothetical protein
MKSSELAVVVWFDSSLDNTLPLSVLSTQVLAPKIGLQFIISVSILRKCLILLEF